MQTRAARVPPGGPAEAAHRAWAPNRPARFELAQRLLAALRKSCRRIGGMNSARTSCACALLALLLLATCPPALPQQAAAAIPWRSSCSASTRHGSGEDRLGRARQSAVRPRRDRHDAGRQPPAGQRSLATARGPAGIAVLAHTAWTQPPAGWNSRRGVSLSQLGVNVPGLSGNVVLERGQFLHLGFDLQHRRWRQD